MAENTESPVVIHDRDETIVGQPQARSAEPHDGKTLVREVTVHTDRVILDPNDELAVQVPEGVGASTVGEVPALTGLHLGTAEDQFERERENDTEDEPSSTTSDQEETSSEDQK